MFSSLFLFDLHLRFLTVSFGDSSLSFRDNVELPTSTFTGLSAVMAYVVLDKKFLSVTSRDDGYIHLKVKTAIKIVILLIFC